MDLARPVILINPSSSITARSPVSIILRVYCLGGSIGIFITQHDIAAAGYFSYPILIGQVYCNLYSPSGYPMVRHVYEIVARSHDRRGFGEAVSLQDLKPDAVKPLITSDPEAQLPIPLTEDGVQAVQTQF